MATYFALNGGVELREVSGEMNSLVGTGDFVIRSRPNAAGQTLLQAAVVPQGGNANASSSGAQISVAGTTFDFVTSSTQAPYRKIDSHTFVFVTEDYMTSYYVTVPKDTDAASLLELDRVLAALAQGKDPNASKAADPLPVTNDVATEEDHKENEAQQGNETQKTLKQGMEFIGALFNAGGAMAKKAGDELVKKAQEDTKLLQEHASRMMGNKPQEEKKAATDTA